MMRTLSLGLGAVLTCTLVLSLAGCGEDAKKQATTPAQEDQHKEDEHAKPESFAVGVETLKTHYLAIKTAFDAGKDDDAHEPLHDVGNMLDTLPDLAKSAELTEDQVQAVQQAVDKLYDAYGQIDSAMHHGEKPDYAAVSQTLDENMAVLEQAVPE